MADGSLRVLDGRGVSINEGVVQPEDPSWYV